MKRYEDDESLILCFDIFPKGLPMFIDISWTHEEYDTIHEKCPEPDRARMYPHPIECHREPIETYSNKKHSRTRIGHQCSQWLYESRMPLLDRKKIRTTDREKYTEKTPNIDVLSQEYHTRKHGRYRDKSLHRRDQWYLTKWERLEVEIFPEIIEKSTASNNPDKVCILNMTRYPFANKKWKGHDDKGKRTYPRQYSCIKGLEWLLRRNILEGIQEREDEKGVEVDQKRKDYSIEKSEILL